VIRLGKNVGEELNVRAAHSSVFGDIGHDIPGTPALVESIKGVKEVSPLFRPPPSCQGFSSNIQPNGNRFAVFRDGVCGPFGVLESCRAKVHTNGAGRESVLQRLVVSNAARKFNIDFLADGFHDLANDGSVITSAKSCVEVHEMQPFGTLLHPLFGSLDRVAVGRLGSGFALSESDSFPAGNINGGQQDQLGRLRELVHKKSEDKTFW